MPDRNNKGQFVKGNSSGKGRPKGSRNELTKKLLERFKARNQDGISIEELMFDIAQNIGGQYDTELRFKAAAKLADIVFPKTAQVELEVEKESPSLEEIDGRIAELAAEVAIAENK